MRGLWWCGLALVGCGRGDWKPIAEGLDAALLSVSGTSADDVWTVGADAGDGPLVLRWDGEAWERVHTGTAGDLWWIWLSAEEAWMVGDGGRVLHLDRASGAILEEVLDPDATLFGVWSDGAGGVRTVGGDLNVGAGGARAFRLESDGWTPDPLPEAAAAQTAVFKVWGRGPSDLWAVGAGGAVLRDLGAGWVEVPNPVQTSLLTVHGDDSSTWAVGGYGNGVALRLVESGAVNDSPAMAPAFNGVFATGGGDVLAVGRSGGVWRRTGGQWETNPKPAPTLGDLHAVWVDPEGGEWAVGGSLASRPLDEGVLVHRGGRVARYEP